MTQSEILSNLRRLIGSPDTNEVSNRDLMEWISSASDWLASELKNAYVTSETMLALTADQQEIPLPPDLGWVLWVEYNGVRLTPQSHFAWLQNGTNYRTATSGTPTEFAVYGRKMILNPPPSSAAITTDDTLTIRYIATTRALTAGGIADLSDMDARLMLYEAAAEYLSLHPSDVNQARAQACLTQVQRLLPAAKERARSPIEDQRPQFIPMIRRSGGAR